MTGENDHNNLDGLQAELEQERETKETLEESVSDLRRTTRELQDRLHSVDGEGNEWKTRFEAQTELNKQLDRQMSLIRERLDGLRGKPMDRLASIRSYDDMAVETLRQRLKLLTEEKTNLQSQLMDCHLRIEQEGKAFLKTNDERRAYLSEIAKVSSTLESHRRQHSIQPQRAPESKQRRGKQASRKAEADTQKGKERGDDEGGVHVKGADGGVGAAEGRHEKRSEKGKIRRALADRVTLPPPRINTT
ncbi:coiled-coil domain-containing protein 169 [Brachionichthys hirsutus]|uniref:coiled-coil domain-containing protein 169 n=1 Tax=Brachionichthys hirsutus TaxID=412623 RepID=UPI003605098C